MKYRSWWFVLGVLDAALVAGAMLLSLGLYYTGSLPADLVRGALPVLLPLTMALTIGCNKVFGLYQRVWRYAGLETAVAIGVSTTVALLCAALLGRAAAHPFPVIVWWTTWLLGIFATIGTRFFWRLAQPRLEAIANAQRGAGSGGGKTTVLIYGVGSLGCSTARLIEQQASPCYHLVGFLDDDPQTRRMHVGGYRVLGSGDDLAALVERYRVDEVIIAETDLRTARLEDILRACRDAKVKATVMPSLLEMLDDHRPLPREITAEDILGRASPSTGVALPHNYLANKTVLVTGAGGSIGSELSRQICRHNPAHLILLGRGENRIHWIYLQLQKRFAHVRITPIVHNITAGHAMERLFDEYRPDIVFHAAAHKHVYLMEDVPVEAVRNNVLATNGLARLAEKYGVAKFVFISTDKAVAPTSVMGATKRACELLLVNRPRVKTEYVCVRFGNVLGSEGSVLEIFKRQWRNGEPLTVTHPEATRYFMSIPEAAFLVLQAGTLGEHGDIMLLDMGEPVLINRLAMDFILLHGGNPNNPNAIQYTGLREGEKLHEALVHERESLHPTESHLISKITGQAGMVPPATVQEYLRGLALAVEAEDNEEAAWLLSEFTGGSLRPQQRLRLHRIIS